MVQACYKRKRDKCAQRTALQLPPRRAPQDSLKNRTISRAEGGQLQAPVGPHRRTMLPWFCLLQSDISPKLSDTQTAPFRPQTSQLESLLSLVAYSNRCVPSA